MRRRSVRICLLRPSSKPSRNQRVRRERVSPLPRPPLARARRGVRGAALPAGRLAAHPGEQPHPGRRRRTAPGGTVHLADADETMRRFPQLAVALPYAFGSCLRAGERGWRDLRGAGVVWAAGTGQRRAVQGRSAARCAPSPTGSAPPSPPCAPVPAIPSSATRRRFPSRSRLPRLRPYGSACSTGTSSPAALTADDELCAIFGLDPGAFDGRAETLAARSAPRRPSPRFRAAARAAADEGRILARRLRVRIAGRRRRAPHRRVVGPRTGGRRRRGRATHLVGAVVDARAGMAAVAAVERLRGRALLPRPGRAGHLRQPQPGTAAATYAGTELLGRRLWDVLPWLADPAYEYRLPGRDGLPAAGLLPGPPPARPVARLLPPPGRARA